MFKNLTIRQISLYLAIAIFTINLVFCIIFFFFIGTLDVQISKGVVFFVFQIILLIAFFLVVRYFLESFVFRKLKVIYKIISESKLPGNDSKPVVNALKTSLDDVNAEVFKWAEKTTKEISYLKTLEEYRKSYVGDISHELKTPIFTIQGYIHTLLDGGIYDESINIQYLTRAAKNIERLQVIVEDLELINKLESGGMILEEITFDIKKLVQEVLLDLKSAADEKSIKLEFKEGANKSYTVKGDQESIRQVLINLMSNSIKYGKEGGTTKISFYDLESKVLVEASDNGIGIEEKHMKHLFDRFYRADTSRSRSQGGSGLGLSIVKHIIEAHHETINVRSTFGVGSTFGFTLKKA